ncbi:MAG TPA: CRISPR-associated endonuclease Cas1 [Bryobacteraceae bacterium]
MALPAASPLAPEPAGEPHNLPEYLPARMVNEFVYCPRLFFYEWVEGIFRESADTVEGSQQHKRVDKEGKGLPAAEDLPDDLKTRSITLASEAHKVIAKVDLLEAKDGVVTPVDYKRGRPRETEAGLEMWPPDRVQLALQALILRENGYRCEEAIVYYSATKQRVRLAVDENVLAEAIAATGEAWSAARCGVLPAPLEDSPKCPGCSLVGICLPEETNSLLRGVAGQDDGQLVLFDGHTPPKKPPRNEVRRLVTPRTDLRPAYLNTQGLRVGKSGEVLQVKEKDALRQEIRLNEICQLNLMGNIQVSTQAVQALAEADVPVCYFSQGGWFYGITMGLSTKNVFLRKAQFKFAEEEWFCLRLAKKLVAGKIRNQRTMLMRNHEEPPVVVLEQMKAMALRADETQSLEELLGIEGNGARLYFGDFAGMLKTEEENANDFPFDFQKRNRRPPRDPVNALLSLGYSMLAKDFTVACYAVGFDPMMGFYHQPRFGRPALALDLMEPFRPLIVESAVLQAINTRMVTARDFVAAGRAVALKPEGRKTFYQAYEARMDTLVTHPLFEYRLSYRRMLEVQARLLAKYLEGSIPDYPVFVTR